MAGVQPDLPPAGAGGHRQQSLAAGCAQLLTDPDAVRREAPWPGGWVGLIAGLPASLPASLPGCQVGVCHEGCGPGGRIYVAAGLFGRVDSMRCADSRPGDRIYVAAGLLGRQQRCADRAGQQRADRDRAAAPAGSGVHRGELGVFAEATAGGVHGGELGLQQFAGGRQPHRVGHRQRRHGPQRGPAGDGGIRRPCRLRGDGWRRGGR
jgi:hypothetical protein